MPRTSNKYVKYARAGVRTLKRAVPYAMAMAGGTKMADRVYRQTQRQVNQILRNALQRARGSLPTSAQQLSNAMTQGYDPLGLTGTAMTQTLGSYGTKRKRQTFLGQPMGKHYWKRQKKLSSKTKNQTLKQIQYNKESIGSSNSISGTSEAAGYVGHFTMPFNLVTKHVFRAMLKAAYAKRHYSINSFGTVVPVEYVGDQLIIRGYREADFVTLVDIATYTILTGDTFEKVANDLWSSWTTNRLPRDYYQHIDIDQADGGTSRFNFASMYFNGYVKSKLKVQNRTAADDGTGDETLDKSNIASNPVGGLVYYGIGCAPRLKGQKAAAFHGEGATGVIEDPTAIAAFNDAWYTPPKPAQLTRCTGSKKVHISPGDIQTSILTQSLTFGFNKLNNLFNDASAVTTQGAGPGKYALFGLDKMIHESTSPEISLVYECDYSISLGCTIKVNMVTNPINE